ncbi:MAG: hypothetical protein ACOZDY_15160 [Pseudomonadota bacterium]
MLHTATLILCWAAISVLLQRVGGVPLIAIAVAALAATAGVGALHRLAGLLRRSRWLLLAVVVLHAVPALVAGPAWNAQSVLSGTVAGAGQAVRLAVLLALLAIVLQRRTREDLVTGIYTLMAPLAWLGVDRGRFAARLCLTLTYFEQSAPATPRRGMAAALAEVERAPDQDGGAIVLPLDRLGTADQVAMAAIGFALGVALL